MAHFIAMYLREACDWIKCLYKGMRYVALVVLIVLCGNSLRLKSLCTVTKFPYLKAWKIMKTGGFIEITGQY